MTFNAFCTVAVNLIEFSYLQELINIPPQYTHLQVPQLYRTGVCILCL